MDGRAKTIAVGLLAGASAVAGGCGWGKQSGAAAQIQPLPAPVSHTQPSRISQFFGASGPAVPPEQVEVREARRPGEPPKPDTFAALADVEVEAAFDGRPATARDQLLDSARQKYQKALAADPKNRGALAGLARLYNKSGDPARAIATLGQAMQAHPKDHELCYKAAQVYAQAGDWQGAAEACRRGLALDPENRNYQKTLGYCLAQLGQWDESLAAMMKVMPEPHARHFLGNVLLEQGRPADARGQFAMAAQMDPKLVQSLEMIAAIDAGQTPPAGDTRTVGFEEGK